MITFIGPSAASLCNFDKRSVAMIPAKTALAALAPQTDSLFGRLNQKTSVDQRREVELQLLTIDALPDDHRGLLTDPSITELSLARLLVHLIETSNKKKKHRPNSVLVVQLPASNGTDAAVSPTNGRSSKALA